MSGDGGLNDWLRGLKGMVPTALDEVRANLERSIQPIVIRLLRGS